MTRTISLHIPRRVSKHLPNTPEKITLPSVSLPHLSRSKMHLPHLSLASLPEEARRPIYATVGAGDLAVERVREAATAVQERITGAQKSLSEKAGDLSEKAGGVVGDNVSAATSTYDEFTRRGAKVMERFWPAAAVPSAATDQPIPAAANTAPESDAKPVAKTSKSAPKGATKPAAKPAVKRAVKMAPKNVAPKGTAPKPVTRRVPKPATDSASSAAPTLKSVQE
jgi:hypothetical protein